MRFVSVMSIGCVLPGHSGPRRWPPIPNRGVRGEWRALPARIDACTTEPSATNDAARSSAVRALGTRRKDLDIDRIGRDVPGRRAAQAAPEMVAS